MSSLILASGSSARQEILQNAGYNFEVIPADIDESTIQNQALDNGEKVENIAQILANEKAKHVSKIKPESYVVGSDQVLIFGGEIFSKSKTKEEAVERLKLFSGKVHYLVSAVSVYKNEEKLFSYADAVMMNCKNLSDENILNYSKIADDILTKCVGGYAFEGIGSKLFENIEGDYFTILGMPLLPLTNFLDSEGFGL